MREWITRHAPVVQRQISFLPSEELPYDGYRIRIDASGNIEVTYRNGRAREYALQTLQTLEERGLEVGEYYEYPDFAMRGVVEGFYGEPYTWEIRRDVIRFLQAHRMNAYFYAPKDDPFHRDRWREAYPDGLLREIAALNSEAESCGVDFYFCLSPGKDFRFSSPDDYAALASKYQAVRRAGIRNFALFLDDIDPKLCAKDAEKFGSPGKAHAALADFCVSSIPSLRPWVFCPTEYMQNYDTQYRRDFRTNLRGDLIVFWTGYNTVAEAITAEDGERVAAAFSRPLALWDNYPVNDFEPKRRLYLAAVRNRSAALKKTHCGYVVNPMSNWEASKFALATQAEYCWNTETYNHGEAEERACAELVPGAPEEALELIKRNSSRLFGETDRLLPYLRSGNWQSADAYYTRQKEMTVKLRQAMPEKMAEAFSELFRYMSEECVLYEEVKEGRVRGETLRSLRECRWRTADQSLLRYIEEKHLTDQPVGLEEERKIWWKLQENGNA